MKRDAQVWTGRGNGIATWDDDQSEDCGRDEMGGLSGKQGDSS
jgi:hypothetical protein